MIAIRQYLDERGRSPFGEWRAELDDFARAKVTTAVLRLEQGNTSNVKSVGEGISELKIDFGPGYRIYFGRDGTTVVILLGGGTKKRQQQDVARAQERWRDYKRRKAGNRMPLTRAFRETVLEDMKRNPGFREAMLREGIDALLSDDLELGKGILRDYINATIGFEKLGTKLKMSPKSLMRMFGPKGNPQAKNLFAVIRVLQRDAGVELHVAAE
jgi:putative addiction module killer protein